MLLRFELDIDENEDSLKSSVQINELFSARKQSNTFLQISHPYTNFTFCIFLSVFVSRIFQ